jgi:hypothetical protein
MLERIPLLMNASRKEITHSGGLTEILFNETAHKGM